LLRQGRPLLFRGRAFWGRWGPSGGEGNGKDVKGAHDHAGEVMKKSWARPVLSWKRWPLTKTEGEKERARERDAQKDSSNMPELESSYFCAKSKSGSKKARQRVLGRAAMLKSREKTSCSEHLLK